MKKNSSKSDYYDYDYDSADENNSPDGDPINIPYVPAPGRSSFCDTAAPSIAHSLSTFHCRLFYSVSIPLPSILFRHPSPFTSPCGIHISLRYRAVQRVVGPLAQAIDRE